MRDPAAKRPIPRENGAPRVELALLPIVLLGPPAVAALLFLQARESGDWRAVAFAGALLAGAGAFVAPLAQRARR